MCTLVYTNIYRLLYFVSITMLIALNKRVWESGLNQSIKIEQWISQSSVATVLNSGALVRAMLSTRVGRLQHC